MPAHQVQAAADVLAGPGKVLKIAELRLRHQLGDVVGVVTGGQVAGDDRAGARPRNVDPLLDRLLGMLSKPEKRTSQTEALDTPATEDPVRLLDPFHRRPPPTIVDAPQEQTAR